MTGARRQRQILLERARLLTTAHEAIVCCQSHHHSVTLGPKHVPLQVPDFSRIMSPPWRSRSRAHHARIMLLRSNSYCQRRQAFAKGKPTSGGAALAHRSFLDARSAPSRLIVSLPVARTRLALKLQTPIATAQESPRLLAMCIAIWP